MLAMDHCPHCLAEFLLADFLSLERMNAVRYAGNHSRVIRQEEVICEFVVCSWLFNH